MQKRRYDMHIFNLVFGIIMITTGTWAVFTSASGWPEKTKWNNLPTGKYTEIKDYKNDRYVIEDAYGKEVVVFKRVRKEV